MTKVQTAYHRIQVAIQQALDDGVNVFVGGEPAVIQVTAGKESGSLRTAVDPKTDMRSQNRNVRIEHTQSSAYTGNTCTNCGVAMMIRNGTCELCTNCGHTSGCS